MPRLIDTLGLAHGALDVEGANVLPVLLQQGDQEVNGKNDVLEELIGGHGNVSNGNTEAEHLLKLELDGGADFLDFGQDVISVVDDSGELADLVKSRSQNTGNNLDQAFRGQESIILLGEHLDLLLVLVELLQIIDGSEFQTGFLGLVAVSLISDNANGELGAGNVAQLDASGETLILGGIVVLQSNLEFDGFDELPLGFLGFLEHSIDGFQ